MQSFAIREEVFPSTQVLESNAEVIEERIFSYPSLFTRLWQGSLRIGLLFSFLHWAWVTLRAALTAAAAAGQLLFPSLSPLSLPVVIWPNIRLYPVTPLEFLGAHVALFFALLVVLLLYNMFPQVMLRGHGLSIAALDGWVTIPWKGIKRLVSTDALAGERLVVFVEVAPGVLGQRWKLYGLAFGLGPRPGFFLATDLSGFDKVVATVASKLVEAREKEEISEEEVQEHHHFWFLKLTLDLPNYLIQIIDIRAWQKPSTPHAALIWTGLAAGWLVLALFGASTMSGPGLLSLIALLFLAALEVVVVPFGLWALGDIYSGYSNWKEIALIYPISQFPRLLFLPWLALALTSALPTLLLGVVGALAAVGVGYLSAVFTQVYYNLPSSRSAFVGGILPALYYFILWAIFLMS